MHSQNIWKPVQFDAKWNLVKTDRFDNLYPSWVIRRAELSKQPDQYLLFIDQLKRRQAIDTGVIEQMYDLERGVTETFIKKGFVDSYLQHGDTDIEPGLLMDYLKDNFEAIDFVFDFVKSNRQLSVSYIRELHQLITRHQETTEAIDQYGRRFQIPLLRGQFKQQPNNPVRDGIVYNYCPPEQVDSEMDNLVRIFNTELSTSHVLVKAAFLHHAFVQIHPFQDGNGRLARLLASFVLIRGDLFPFSLNRKDRIKYIDALENADEQVYQNLVDVIAENQISSIERALNWNTVPSTEEYKDVIDIFGEKLSNYYGSKTEQKNQRISAHMAGAFAVMKNKLEEMRESLMQKLNDGLPKIATAYCDFNEANARYYARQIIAYANQHDYYANLSLGRCWCRLLIQIDEMKIYRLVISLHHYGYDDSTFAIGAFFSKLIHDSEDEKQEREYIDIPLSLLPLTISSEKDVTQLRASIEQQVELSVTAALACIANELG